MPKPIIAAVDPRRDDVAPALLGAAFARLNGAPLVVAGTYPADHSVDILYPEYARTLQHDSERALRRVAESLEGVGEARVAPLPAAGSPARMLHELAEAELASILVIGSSRRGQVGRVLPGAVTDRLLHGAPCPVAVAPAGFSSEQARGWPERIGVAFADTPDGRTALTAACALADRAGARVRVLTVSEPLDWVVNRTLDGVALADASRAREAAAETVLRHGLDAVPAERSDGGEILTGRPAEALAAASVELDLLVCGSRGYGPVRTLMLGSTSHALVREAACPVLVVPRQAGARAGAPANDDRVTA